MSADEPRRRVRRALAVSIVDGVLYATMVGLGESYLGALAVELGHRDTALALLVTVPLLAGALAQLASAPLARSLGGRKRLVVVGAALQAASHLGFVAIAATGDRRLWTLLAAKMAFWISGSAIGPAWGAWMASLTEGVARERYFARRSALVHFTLLASFAGAGAWLDGAQARGATLGVFATLFALGLAARSLSATALAAQADPGSREAAPVAGETGRLGAAVRTSRWRVALYMAALMLGAHVAAPFFTPYMLRTLRLDYGAFAALTAASVLAKALAFPTCHRVARRVGLRPLLAVSGLGAALVPLVWAVARSKAGILAAEVLAGVSWAGVEYASFQLLLVSARPDCRVEFLGLAGALAGVAQLAGGVVGGALRDTVGLGYPQVFVVSAALRALALVPLVAAARPAELPRRLVMPLLRLMGLRPSGGAVRGSFPPDPPSGAAPREGADDPRTRS